MLQPLNLLVPTKLSPPLLQPAWIKRERLIAQLDAGCTSLLTIVVAPAGFGKSTLVAQWLLEAQSAEPHASARRLYPASFAWLTLDEHDQDGLRFLAYVAGAIERVRPQALVVTRPLLNAPEPPPLYAVAQALLMDLSTLSSGLTLVLDDYHTITAQPVHQIVTYLLRHWPPACRLVILSRIVPPLALVRLRAQQQLTELRVTELRFSEAEAGAMLTSLFGHSPNPALISALYQETEGWALALQLAALSVRQSPASPRTPGAATRQISEYLTDEVFAQQPAPIQAALLALAVPERVCAGLGAALLDPPGDLAHADALLNQLVRDNLFLLPFDGEGRWYRFHHLFRDLLLQRLTLTAGASVRTLQLRAAHWLEAEGLIEEAVRLLLEAGDETAAGALIERQLTIEASQSGNNARLGYWLRTLPAELVTRRPGLALIAAHLAAVNLDLPALQANLARVDELLAPYKATSHPLPWPTFAADLVAIRAILHCWQGRSVEAISGFKLALEQGVMYTLAGRIRILWGMALVGAGQDGPALHAFANDAAHATDMAVPERELYHQARFAAMYLLAGNLEILAQQSRRITQVIAANRLNVTTEAFLNLCLGMAAYERSDLATAAAHFATVTAHQYHINHSTYISGVIGQALVAVAQGALDDAAGYAQAALASADEGGGSFLRHQALGCAVRVALAQGDHAAALRASAGIKPDIHLGPSIWIETPRLSQVLALISAAGEDHLLEAERILAACLAELEAQHNLWLLVRALATQALLQQTQGNPAQALATLKRALSIAIPRGFIRSLVDLGPPLAPLLSALADQGSASTYLSQVLAAYTPEQIQQTPAGSSASLPEPLTRREREILALLAERWSDKEIASRLVIASNTVRKHTSTIYDKLGVNSRRDAVYTARTLGLLPPE